MLRLLRQHLATITVAFVTAAVTAGGPAVAAVVADYARNSDQVDGRDAVGAGASAAERAGNVVATNRAGKLPASAIPTVSNAEKLDGLDAAKFTRSVLPSGQTLRGDYAAWGSSNGYFGDTVQFRMRIPSDVDSADVSWMSSVAAPTAECPGPGRAAAGHLCVYEVGGGSRSAGVVIAPEDGGRGASTFGFSVKFLASGGGAGFSYGTWAYRAP